MAATLDDVKVFRTAKGGAKNNGKDPVVIELRRTRGMSKRTFDRKARALEKLGSEGKLVRHKVPKRKGQDGDYVNPRDRSVTSKHREETINRETAKHTGDPAAQAEVRRKYAVMDPPKGSEGSKGMGQDPDHIHELQLGGPDNASNLSWEDAYTQRKIGKDLKYAMDQAGVEYGTPVIVRIVD
ncbi:hypothetical protein [Glycomyces sp. NRRL B-16210]|uniref:hypothetical protein n=1 Tax=Glycomyces sp. NRRL B-16210 TaxID=1463821 RepID=UPI0004C065B7|nr:hypothetical protein [Glycomyces sp. NRRL B-16210]